MKHLFLFLLASISLLAEPLTFNTTPLGSLDKPLILRTYVPDPGLDPAVLPNHHQAAKSPKYSPKTGRDIKGEYETMPVLPACIAVNHGPALSYVFCTLECRVLYAWQGGFLDMFPYWGEQDGNRRAFDYHPRLIGNLFYLAQPETNNFKPKFLGYDLNKDGIPSFLLEVDDLNVRVTILPSEKPLSFKLDTQIENVVDGQKTQTITGQLLSTHSGFDRTIKIDEPNKNAGQLVFQAYGCVACHSTDGSKGHGPTLLGLFGSTRPLENADPILADNAYIRESITNPNAKTAHGYPPNYMPPYQMKPKELDSLVLFVEHLATHKPE